MLVADSDSPVVFRDGGGVNGYEAWPIEKGVTAPLETSRLWFATGDESDCLSSAWLSISLCTACFHCSDLRIRSSLRFLLIPVGFHDAGGVEIWVPLSAMTTELERRSIGVEISKSLPCLSRACERRVLRVREIQAPSSRRKGCLAQLLVWGRP